MFSKPLPLAFEDMAVEAARLYDIDPHWLMAHMLQESRYFQTPSAELERSAFYRFFRALERGLHLAWDSQEGLSMPTISSTPESPFDTPRGTSTH